MTDTTLLHYGLGCLVIVAGLPFLFRPDQVFAGQFEEPIYPSARKRLGLRCQGALLVVLGLWFALGAQGLPDMVRLGRQVMTNAAVSVQEAAEALSEEPDIPSRHYEYTPAEERY